MKNLPKEIYLNVGDIGDEVNEEVEFNELATGEVTWSREKIFDHDIKYVLYESLPHERVVKPTLADKDFGKLMMKVNYITSCYRHGREIPSKRMDRLSDMNAEFMKKYFRIVRDD